MTGHHGARNLAWALGGSGAAACALTLAATIAAGLASEELLLLPTFIASGLLGALIASRAPANAIGWLMCGASLAAMLLFLPLDYGYAAQATHRGEWPLGGAALWFGAWGWTPLLGLFLPLLTVRFPDGTVSGRWRAVDWLAVAGTVIVALGAVLAPAEILIRLLLLPHELLAAVQPLIDNPVGLNLPEVYFGVAIWSGTGLILLAYGMAIASVVDRFRRAAGEVRLQLKWFVYSVAVVAAVIAVGATAELSGLTGSRSIDVFIHLGFFALPLGIGVAVLRYRLYDIDLIINRTLVYGSLTAILGAVYAAVVTLLNRLFISFSGQKSDAAFVVTAFVVVFASSPVKDWLQHQVDRRVAHRSPSTVLDELRADVDAVISVLDVHKVACRLLDEAVSAFDARGGALYLHTAENDPVYSRGHLNGETIVEVVLRYEDQRLGRLVLGRRRGDIAYSQRDLAALQRSADSIGEALALAAHLGFRPLPRSGGQRGVEPGSKR